MTRIKGRTAFARTCEEVLDILADPHDEPLFQPAHPVRTQGKATLPASWLGRERPR